MEEVIRKEKILWDFHFLPEIHSSKSPVFLPHFIYVSSNDFLPNWSHPISSNVMLTNHLILFESLLWRKSFFIFVFPWYLFSSASFPHSIFFSFLFFFFLFFSFLFFSFLFFSFLFFSLKHSTCSFLFFFSFIERQHVQD